MMTLVFGQWQSDLKENLTQSANPAIDQPLDGLHAVLLRRSVKLCHTLEGLPVILDDIYVLRLSAVERDDQRALRTIPTAERSAYPLNSLPRRLG